MAGVAPDVTAIPLGRPLPSASSNQPERQGLRIRPRGRSRAIAPIRSCSRRGLPCHRRCRRRGALLPHPFTLTLERTSSARIGRFAFCGAFPGVAPAGRYPAPHPYGARTFLRPKKRRPSSRLASTAYERDGARVKDKKTDCLSRGHLPLEKLRSPTPKPNRKTSLLPLWPPRGSSDDRD